MDIEDLKIGIIGDGLIGSFLYESFLNELNGYNVSLYYDEKFNLTKLKKNIKDNNIIINCLEYSNVDSAETEKKLCKKINYNFVQKLVNLIKDSNKKLIHFSSDYVYGNVHSSGEGIKETDQCKPCNYYGKTKLMADNYILNNLTDNFLILRTSWVFGPKGHNFINNIIHQIKENDIITVVNDQFGNITSTYLIYKIVKIYVDGLLSSGLYNLSCTSSPNHGNPSRFDICSKIIEFLKIRDVSINVCASNENKDCAVRQLNSLLNCDKLDHELLRNSNITRTCWEIELSNYLQMYPTK